MAKCYALIDTGTTRSCVSEATLIDTGTTRSCVSKAYHPTPMLPNLKDLLHVLARSASGKQFSTYKITYFFFYFRTMAIYIFFHNL